MKKLTFLGTLVFLTLSCNLKIKNSETSILVEEGTQVIAENITKKVQDRTPKIAQVKNNSDILGYYVGDFREDVKDDKTIFIGGEGGFYWDRTNKINISIDKITDSLVVGHSVVAGNNRPFSGVIKNGVFVVKEPGDHKYDGVFKFKIEHNQYLEGTWSAYKDIDIKHRKFSLRKTTFSYDPDIILEKRNEYAEWNKFIKKKIIEKYEDGEIQEWIRFEFYTATDLIYSMNASNTLLKEEDVENLKKGDITVIRNTIYARHGYSFKHRPLRVFFDEQDWYIPVHSDIKSDFTNIEKQNIQLLLRYEKNAQEYYDYFGR